jgi:hypothetical protein
MEMQKEIDKFLSSPAVLRALRGLGPTAKILAQINAKHYLVVWEEGSLIAKSLGEGENEAADFEFFASEAAAMALIAEAGKPKASPASLGIYSIAQVFSSREDRRIGFRVNAPLFTLMRKGYFSVLMAGGPEVFSELGKRGFGSLAKVRNVLRKTKG